MSSVRVAVVQAASVAFDREATLAKLDRLAREAVAGGARLVVFPEAFVAGYPKGSTFDTVIGKRTTEGREAYRRYWESAVDVPGPDVDRMAALARELDVHMVVSVIERDGGTLYCTTLTFSPAGYLGKHRKLMPTAAERLVWGFGDGSTLPVFDTELGKIGSVICWENFMPLLRMAMYAKGVQFYCVPTAFDGELWLSTVRHIAVEGRCFVLSACQFTRRSDYPDWHSSSLGDDPDTIHLHGGSCIISPLGEVLAGPDYDSETILTADCDLDDIVRGKYDFDVVGHYARPDIFELRVNERAQAPVVDWP